MSIILCEEPKLEKPNLMVGWPTIGKRVKLRRCRGATKPKSNFIALENPASWWGFIHDR